MLHFSSNDLDENQEVMSDRNRQKEFGEMTFKRIEDLPENQDTIEKQFMEVMNQKDLK
jgi:hypothetical protein